MTDFCDSARSLASCSLLSTDQISVMTITPTGCTSHFEVWTEEDSTLDEGLSEVEEDESNTMMSQTLTHDPPSTDGPSWHPVRSQTKMIPTGDEHDRLCNCFNDSTQDIPAMLPSRKNSLSCFPTINLLEDEDEEGDEEEGDEEEDVFLDEESLCSIPPLPALMPVREGHYSSSFQSSFSSVFGASQGSDFPLARPSRSLSPLVSPAGKNNNYYDNDSESMSSPPAPGGSVGSIGSCSFLKLSSSMAHF
jgi:hypothetical protein